MPSVQCEGIILEEACTSHKQVEWVVKYVPRKDVTKEHFTLTSPEFEIGSQHYKLELSLDWLYWINLLLYRKGPSVDGPSRYVRWWAGIKHTDGTYNDRNVKGELELKNESETWTRVTLHRISEFELQDNIQRRDILVVFFRLSLERALATTKECTHGAAKMSALGIGTIREEECTSHKHVEWKILPDILRKRKNFSSPSFAVGKQSYKLELSFGCHKSLMRSKTLHIHLYSKEPPIAGSSRPSRWWAGMKHSDGRCLRGNNGRGTLNMKKECEIWTQKNLYTIKEDELRGLSNNQQFHLVVFFRLSFERTSRIAKICNHIPTMTSFAWSNGTIREINHSSYKHLEWETRVDVRNLTSRRHDLMSPEFAIGSQRHKLELCLDTPKLELNLYSRGPSVGPSRTAPWWAGFKRSDGTPILKYICGITDLEELCELWTQKCLYSVYKDAVEEELHEMNGQLIIVFRMKLRQEPIAAEACTDGTTDMSTAPCEGSIQEVECDFHKQVEWIIPDLSNIVFRLSTSSPDFSIGTQQFKFEFYFNFDVQSFPLLCLRLYSRGTSVVGHCRSLQWCMGLKRGDESYQHKVLRGELDMKEACEIWTPRGFVNFSFDECLSSKLNFFFRVKKETAPMSANTCIHNAVERHAKGFGTIDRFEFPSHEQVEWTTVYYDLGTENFNFSPEFRIGNQRYILELSQDSDTCDSMILCLYRRGSSVTEPSQSVRWWAGLKRLKQGNWTYHRKTQRGELDLNEECELWTRIYLHRVCRYELEREVLTPSNTLVVFFRFSVERAAKACTHDDEECLQKIKRPRSEDNSDVVFQVKGKELKISRAILEARIPVFKAMFHHDTVENATGVVIIKDFEPAIFEEFLHYVSTGFVRKLTADNARDLYLVADKYLVDDLQAECLQCISETLSINNFCDVVTLALRHHEDDLLKEATDFFSRNKNIATTDSWKKFCSHNPTEANDLLFKSFLPQERTESNLLRYASACSSK